MNKVYKLMYLNKIFNFIKLYQFVTYKKNTL